MLKYSHCIQPRCGGAAKQAGSDMRSLAEDFRRLRAESLIGLCAVTDQDLERTARHEELGLVSLGEMIHEWAARDLNHTIQAERAMMQPFIDHYVTRRQICSSVKECPIL